jgi:hypothetical protein
MMYVLPTVALVILTLACPVDGLLTDVTLAQLSPDATDPPVFTVNNLKPERETVWAIFTVKLADGAVTFT